MFFSRKCVLLGFWMPSQLPLAKPLPVLLMVQKPTRQPENANSMLVRSGGKRFLTKKANSQRRWEKLRASAKRERSSWIASGTMSKNASLEHWKIAIHKVTWIRKIWCSMCIDGNGADLVTVICSQVWVKPVKNCTDSLRNFCPEKVVSRKCLPLRRNAQNGHFSMTITEL